MKILLLAPHPFYQERGTPIAVDLLLRVLSKRGDEVDVLTYHEGLPREYPGTTIHRIRNLSFIKDVPPGFSWKKVFCDLFLFFKAVKTVRRKKYDIIHAVEESAFIAVFLKKFFKTRYIFDMDSSMPEQIVEGKPVTKFMLPIMRRMEKSAVLNAEAVVVMCEALSKKAADYGGKNVITLTDISLLSTISADKKESTIKNPFSNGTTFMYIGNLQPYQGIDLLLQSFAQAARSSGKINLIIIGGSELDIEEYRIKAAALGIDEKTCFTGPKSISALKQMFEISDILVSPRTQGVNTPMKIFSYMDSGNPILATNLPTHTQVLSEKTALLAKPEPEAFAKAMLKLAQDKTLQKKLAKHASRIVKEKYSFAVFEDKVKELYKSIERKNDTE
ncbi:glycosyltransferase [Verrucomicrobiota bacterium]